MADKRKYWTKFDRPTKKGQLEEIPRESLVEKTGHIPTKVRVQQLMRAGYNLALFRKENFDYTGVRTEAEDDPTISVSRKRNADWVDIDREIDALKARARKVGTKVPEDTKKPLKEAEERSPEEKEVDASPSGKETVED